MQVDFGDARHLFSDLYQTQLEKTTFAFREIFRSVATCSRRNLYKELLLRFILDLKIKHTKENTMTFNKRIIHI